MSLAFILEKAETTLATRWADAADAVYPFAATGFLRTIADPFANPVGQKSRDLAAVLLAAVIGAPHDGTVLRDSLEAFVRVRAVQDIPVEQSLQVMFAYKGLIRSYLREHTITMTEALRTELEAADERCDTLALLAFGAYVRAREAFHELRVADVRRRHTQVMRLARRHGLVDPGSSEESPEQNGA